MILEPLTAKKELFTPGACGTQSENAFTGEGSYGALTLHEKDKQKKGGGLTYI